MKATLLPLCICRSLALFGGTAAFSLTQDRHRTGFEFGRRQSKDLCDVHDDNDISQSRRDALRGLAGSMSMTSSFFVLPKVSGAATPAPLQTAGGSAIRVEEIGGGLDLLSPNPSLLSSSDVFYPSSMINTRWKVQRVVTSVEGDLGQAALAWKLLGGSDERAFTSKLTEVYEVQFIAAPEAMKDATYEYGGKSLRAAILDRTSELSSRMNLAIDAVDWDTDAIDSIGYTRNNDGVNIKVFQRKIERPTEVGFGSDEIYRIQSSAGGIFAGTNVYRAARVRRRYRRGFDESTGKRILDCIEIVTTHRVLDGVAGIELPTSTCKSRLRYNVLASGLFHAEDTAEKSQGKEFLRANSVVNRKLQFQSSFVWDPYMIYDGAKMIILLKSTQGATCAFTTAATATCTLGPLGNQSVYSTGDHHQCEIDLQTISSSDVTYEVECDGESKGGTFKVPPGPTSRTKLIAYGDTRDHPEIHDNVALSMLTHSSDYLGLVLHVGSPMNGCRGNHEMDGNCDMGPFDAYATLYDSIFPYHWADAVPGWSEGTDDKCPESDESFDSVYPHRHLSYSFD
ncbi:hypothetical protein ACHAWF_014321 [Thalassiosira exigua]